MNVTRNWLSKFIDIKTIKDEEITIALNSLGFEVDSYKNYSKMNDKLTIGHVGSVTPIEGTHLNFTFVDKGEELVSPIVCGAGNVSEGQFVVVAEPGKTIANGMKLDIREIKGRQSEGMICALSEIGMDDSVQTEKELDSIYEIHTKGDAYSLIGTKDALSEIGFNDSVWEVDLTLNRSDALSALQIAKELANYFDIQFNDFSESLEPKNSEKSVPISFKVDENSDKFVKTIAASLIEKKDVLHIEEEKLNIYSEQDLWLKFSGVKTTENFFKDLSNAIAIETGQPVIFLDPDKLDQELIIKDNPTSEKSTNLQLMCGEKVVSTIGVDVESEFLPSVNSKQYLAIYLSIDPIFMRKQQKAFNLSTPAIQRYMKPISQHLYKLANQRVIYWFDQYSLLGSISEIEVFREPELLENVLNVELSYIYSVLGFEIPVEKIIYLFANLDINVEPNGDSLIFKVGHERTDITQAADIVEEIARLYGYNNIEPVAPLLVAHEKKTQVNNKIANQIESYLLGQRFNNIKTYSLQNNDEVVKWDLFEVKKAIKLLSPLSKLRETYRLSLFSSLIETASFNSSKGNKELKLYEFSDIYNMENVRERRLGFITVGNIVEDKARKTLIKADYSYIKGLIVAILDRYQFDPSEISFNNITKLEVKEIHPYINAEIKFKDEVIGYVFKLNPRTEQSFKLDSTYVAELNISKIESLFDSKIIAKDIPKFQKTSRDVSMIVGKDTKYQDIIKDIIKGVENLTASNVFDIYSDETLDKNNTISLSVKFEFNSKDHQLTDEEVNKSWNVLLDNIKKLKIEVR